MSGCCTIVGRCNHLLSHCPRGESDQRRESALHRLCAVGQGAFKKAAKGNDYIVVVNDGIQFSVAATYLIPSAEVNGENDLLSGNRESYSIVPQGRLGYAAELGFAHFPKWKGIPIKFLRKSRIWDYFDWGLGYKVFSGKETTSINLLDASGVTISSDEGVGSFKLGMFSARLSAHSLIYFGKKKIDKARKHFIDNAFGLNFEYRPSSGDTIYNDGFAAYAKPQRFQAPYNLQFHYSLGVGIRFNRAWMMIPTLEIPLMYSGAYGIFDIEGVTTTSLIQSISRANNSAPKEKTTT